MSKPKNTYTTIQSHETSDYDVNKANDFIEEWKNLAIYLSLEIAKRDTRFFSLDFVKSTALEACLRAYLYIEKNKITHIPYIRGVIRLSTKRTFWTLATYFGFVPSRGQVYFPKSWENYDELFKDQPLEGFIKNKLDNSLLKQLIKKLPDNKRFVFERYIEGYDFSEISKMMGFAVRSSSRHIFDRQIDLWRSQFSI